jgi:hypothetical protein
MLLGVLSLITSMGFCLTRPLPPLEEGSLASSLPLPTLLLERWSLCTGVTLYYLYCTLVYSFASVKTIKIIPLGSDKISDLSVTFLSLLKCQFAQFI